MDTPLFDGFDEETASQEALQSAIPEISEELIWQFKTGLNPDTLCGAIETIIFMNDHPVALLKIRNLIDESIPLKVVHDAILRLQEEYESGHHGLRLLEVAEGYQFRTKATYSKYIQDMFKANSLVLSPSALEVLAIIAYKQPVSKVTVEKIRGVDSSHIVRQLMDKRLVRVMGRSEELGRPVVYGTTQEFLEVFNLADISELPPEYELEEMATAPKAQIADIKEICAGDKTKFLFDEFEELEALSDTISEINPETEFTKSLRTETVRRTDEEGVVVKSAFDLLEEFVAIKAIKEQNNVASASQSMLPSFEPKVVSELAGIHNAPEIEEDDETFEMIDLDTGEVIPEQEVVEEKFDEAHEVAEEIAEETSAPQEDFLFKSDAGVRDAVSLEAALDAAFANLTGFDFSSDSEEESEKELSSIEDATSGLDEVTSSMQEKASDLDLDLSFLNNTESDPNENVLQ